MQVIIRADASKVIGSGHIMRCLTLADELKDKGAEVFFVCRQMPGDMIGFIESKGYRVLPIVSGNNNDSKAEKTEEQIINNCSTLEETLTFISDQWLEDAIATKEVLITILKESGQLDWLIIDHYALDEKWEKEMRSYTKKIMVIDDMANRIHDCDLLLDQNFYEYAEQRYDKLVPEGCIELLGPKFALLRPEFIVERKKIHKRNGEVKRIFVFFGGADPTNETIKALEAIKMLNRPDIAVDVVIGMSNPHREEIDSLCKALPNTKCYDYTDNMAALMVKADLAIGAGGSTTWERCYLGLPSITVSIADNQALILKALSRINMTYYVGNKEKCTINDLFLHIRKCIDDQSSLLFINQKCQELIDGCGVEEVVKLMKGNYLKISIISQYNSWLNNYIPLLINQFKKLNHLVEWVHDVRDLRKGDIAFYLGCQTVLPKKYLELNKHNLVVHESDLPEGKGWSPLTWQIIEGKGKIPIVLFEAEDKVDSGCIYLKRIMEFNGSELIDELRKKQAETTISMCLEFIDLYPNIINDAVVQQGEATYYRRRGPEDSRINPNMTISQQFNLLRTVDNDVYPAYFEMFDNKYVIRINKV